MYSIAKKIEVTSIPKNLKTFSNSLKLRMNYLRCWIGICLHIVHVNMIQNVFCSESYQNSSPRSEPNHVVVDIADSNSFYDNDSCSNRCAAEFLDPFSEHGCCTINSYDLSHRINVYFNKFNELGSGNYAQVYNVHMYQQVKLTVYTSHIYNIYVLFHTRCFFVTI